MKQSENSFNFLPVVMNQDKFSIKVEALFGDIQEGMVMNVNLIDMAAQQKILSKAFKCVKRNEIVGEIVNKVPSQKTGYTLTASVIGEDRTEIHTDDKEYTIVDETSLLDIKVIAPISKTAESNVTASNNLEMWGDYHFPNNATYINQSKEQVLDLYLPVEVMVLACKDYEIDTVHQWRLTMTDSNKNTYLHCGNQKFNHVTISQDRKRVSIDFAEEWKNHIICNTYDKAETMIKLNIGITADMKYVGNDDDIQGIRQINWSTSSLISNPFTPIMLTWNKDDCE